MSRELPCGWCGVYTRRGPFCESCGSPMPVVFVSVTIEDEPEDAEPIVSLEQPDAEAAVATPSPAVEAEVPCTWCGFMSPPGPACERCGSPMPASFSLGADGALIARRTKKKPPPVIAVRAAGTRS